MGAHVLTLALDVDGVLLDPDRHGDGHWTNELTARFGIERAQLRESFFMTSWDDVVNGRRTVEDGLDEALALIGTTVDVESVLSCWFDADYALVEETFDLARRAAAAGCSVVLATNQEHRRADYLHRRIGAAVPLDGVISSADVGCQQHDPRFFEIASERLGVNLDARTSVVLSSTSASGRIRCTIDARHSDRSGLVSARRSDGCRRLGYLEHIRSGVVVDSAPLRRLQRLEVEGPGLA